MSGDNLFYVSRANIFSIYPNILKKIVGVDDENYSPEKSIAILPSDFEWQLKCYFRLLEQQKKLNTLDKKSVLELSQIERSASLQRQQNTQDEEFRDRDGIVYTPIYSPISPNADRSLIKPLGYCEQEFRLSVSHETNNVIWDLSEFAKAGKLLKTPPMDVEFYDEYEMRKVYSLIYDVFRYIETCLDKMKTKLAASITKIRIEKQALNLQYLLPSHLRDEKVARAVTNPIITGWFNKFKKSLTKRDITKKLEGMGFKELDGCDTKSFPKSFRYDKVCPNFFFLWFPRDKSEFLQDAMIRENDVILQNKAFTVGPAIFAKLVNYFEIAGDILQTHILSPRSTAYLATLLLRNRFVGKLRVFGAGRNYKEYKAYFDKIGATNIQLYEESFLGISRHILEKTVAIYCTPPSSFSSILDPIELICSRGGDLKMLQFLSESEMTDDGQTRATKILREQRETLKSSMSKPQIQFILYETHSIVEAENEDMVQHAMEYVNRKAYDKHLIKAQKERERLEQLEREKENMPGIPTAHREREPKKDAKGKKTKGNEQSASVKINTNKTGMKQSDSLESIDAIDPVAEEAKKDEPLVVNVPLTDLFEVQKLPDFCINRDNCVLRRSEGCFLSLLKRKEIIRMDSKYLIQIAELRGIFGDKDRPKKTKSKAQMRAEKKQEAAMKAAREALERQKIEKTNPSNVDKVVERLLKPTQATIIRITRDEIWRRKYHVMTLRYSQLFPPRCARCDYYSQNYYFLSDKFVAVKQFDDTISLRFEEQSTFQEAITKRRAEKWWDDLLKHIKQIKILSEVSGVEINFDSLDKSLVPPLKLTRFPQGYIAPPPKKKVSKEIRQQYSLSITILDIDQPKTQKLINLRHRSITPRVATLRTYNKCLMCLHEYLRITSGYDQKYMR
ncbi:unnamed protein product [Chironomus riparius]|uniref:Uncharacterized protein n=1 Tax=Chironomus riparius TaxID=315576 RepID=A0A9N9RVU6_9DIPT|nr:unnamed protein product [Chironomus riparius]